MAADELAFAVLAQFQALDVFERKADRYVLCAATAVDRVQYDHVIVLDKAPYISPFGPAGGSNLSFTTTAAVSIEPGPDAPPHSLVDSIRRCQEVRMGATPIHLVLDDGSEVLYEDGTPSVDIVGKRSLRST